MHISFFDDARVSESHLKKKLKQLQSYRDLLSAAVEENNHSIPEYALYYAKNSVLHDAISDAERKTKRLKRVVVIGIGGSSLGTEAVHAALDRGRVGLSVLDTVSVSTMHQLRTLLARHKKVEELAICVISKSGTTTETIANAAILLDELQAKFGAALYRQVYFIGNPNTDFMRQGKRLGAHLVTMPEIIGGRYSVATAVGLIPLALLGHDVDEFLSGYLDALCPPLETVVADGAARLTLYHQFRYPHYNFFAFEPRLEKLGQWYRQLFAESLGKAVTMADRPITFSMVPTISTPVELHSVGQLYMSGVPAVYTDFVSFDDDELDMMISKRTPLTKSLRGYSLQEVATALYGGVIAAYQERQLPYRATVFEENIAYSIGQFMAMRLREVMYVATLLEVNAFNQPNVELYKQKTRELLSL